MEQTDVAFLALLRKMAAAAVVLGEVFAAIVYVESLAAKLMVQASTKETGRLISLDQFRGYTVIGMLVVNYLGSLAACPRILKHSHDYLSYADTIMPQFLFAVGFAMRLSLTKRQLQSGAVGFYSRVVRRLLGLVLLSLVVYSVDKRAETWDGLTSLGFWGAIQEPLKREWFQTLMHIAVTSLWILPVVRANASVRIVWLLGSALLHLWLSHWFNFQWVNTAPRGIDGGPLGFLTWSIPALVGTLAYDVFAQPRQTYKFASATLWRILLAAFLLMLTGYLFSCGTRFYDVAHETNTGDVYPHLAVNPVLPSDSQLDWKFSQPGGLQKYLAEPPFIPPPPAAERQWNYWMMSQRAGSLSYLTFAAGFSLFLYTVFFVFCDLWKLQLGIFRTFGINALLAYVLHEIVANAVRTFVPSDSPAWYAVGSFWIYMGITWLFLRTLEKQGIFLKV